jgi:hypothetical protein
LQPRTTSLKITAMRLLTIIAILGFFTLGAARGLEESKTPQREPTLLHRMLHPFGHRDRAGGPRTTRTKTLALTMLLEPSPLDLSDTRQLKVTLQLKNISKRFIQLEFPTTQRIEILIRDEHGKMVTQWSEDQSFSNVPTTISINPGEHLEYSASISTRDMTAGRAYTVESFFPNFAELKARQALVPQP